MSDIILMKQLIKETINELNEDLQLKQLENISDDTPLFEILDSVGVLDMVLELEDRLQTKYGKYIQLANEYTMDKEETPFANVKKLEKYLEELVK